MKKNLIAKTFAVLGVSFFSVLNLNSAFAADAANNKVLYVYNWTEYIPNSLLKKFTKETGIEVRYSTYESNEELYSKLKLVKGEGYDLIFPSSYYVQLLKKDGLIQKLDKTKVDLQKVMPSLLNKDYDPNNEYSIPYIYGLTAIGVVKSVYDINQIKSWNDLWKPQYKNLVLLNDTMDVFSMGLLAQKNNPNTAKPFQIDMAYGKLKSLIPKVQQFNSDSPEVPYVEGQSGIGMIWSGSAFRGHLETNGDLDIVYPSEGSILWIDNFAISSKAKNVEGAYKFINFILEPANSAEIIKEMGFQTSSANVKPLLPADWQKNHILFPPQEVFDKAIMNSASPERLNYYVKQWNRLKVN